MHAITHEIIEKYPNGYPPFPPEYSKYFKKSPIAWTVMYNPPVAEKMTFHLDEHFAHVPPSCYCLNDPDSSLEFIRANQRNHRFMMEGLVETYPTANVLKRFKSKFSTTVDSALRDVVFPDRFEYGSGKVRDFAYVSDPQEKISPAFAVFVPAKDKADADRVIKEFTDDFQATGYYMTSYRLMDDALPDFLLVLMQLEAKYTDMLADLADVLYHVAPIRCLPKILKNGLVPKAKSVEFKYDDRVYLFNKCPQADVYRYGAYKAKLAGDDGFCVFKARKDDLLNDQLFKSGKQKLYLDSAFNDEEHPQVAVFTYGNVPPRILQKEYVVAKINEEGEVVHAETRTF